MWVIDLFQDCVDKWGTGSQILMAIEELTELSLALCHSLRNNRTVDLDHIAEEIADVRLMLDQVQYIFQIPESDIRKIREIKINRLKDLLAEAEE